jgi:hypothetical protein
MKRSLESPNQDKLFMKKWLRYLYKTILLAMEIVKLGRKKNKRNQLVG